MAADPDDLRRGWGAVGDELRDAAGGRPRVPPPDVLDALAWYVPIHFYGHGWGIYIKESAILLIASHILSYVPEAERRRTSVVAGAVRGALDVLYLHEAFHHKTESFAIRLEIIEHTKRYEPYHSNVYHPLRAGHSDELLEEALACADMVKRLNETTYKEMVPPIVLSATAAMLHDWIPTLPPGYRRGHDLSSPVPYQQALHALSSQVQEARPSPMRRPHEWALVPQAFRGLMSCRAVAYVIVPTGERPKVPWFNRPPLGLVLSTSDAVKLLERHGYEVVTGGGKGSHIKLQSTEPGRSSVVISGNRKELSPGLVRHVAKAAGFASATQLQSALNRR